MNRRLRFSSMVATLLCVALAGCVEVSERITIDGNRGSFEIVASVPKAVRTTLAKDSPYAIFFNGKTGANHFKRPGLAIRNYSVYTNRKGDRTFIKVKGEITDLKKALASGALGNFTLKKGKKGTRLECVITDTEPTKSEARKKAFKDVSLNLTIVVDKKVHETNGKRSGKTVTWELGPDKLKDKTLVLEYE